MTFVSVAFFIFLAIFAPLYAATRGNARLWVILIGSCIFYGWFKWYYLGLLAFSVLLDYTTGRLIAASKSEAVRRLLLGVTIAANLGVLAFFKYFTFLTTNTLTLAKAFDWDLHFSPPQIILPIGISFYTFQSMSYAFDVYRRHMDCERSLLRYAAFVTFFPQLVAGPIVRAYLLLPQLHEDQQLRWDQFFAGARLMLWGYFMKVVVADSLAPYVDNQFNNYQQATSLGLLIAVVFYAFQIYGDFGGYSLIAIGVARIFGFDLGRNFDRPYFSQSFSEFWQRWHISLSSWLRDYLYVPLGGNRYGTLSTYRNLILTMLLGGLWHGASWNFVIWGALHGLYLVVQRLFGPTWSRLTQHLPAMLVQAFSIAVVFFLTCFAWIFFRAQTLEGSLTIIEKIALWDGAGLGHAPLKFIIAKGIALIALLIVLEAISFRVNVVEYFERRPLASLVAGAAIVWSLAFLGTYGGSAFIYFQF